MRAQVTWPALEPYTTQQEVAPLRLLSFDIMVTTSFCLFQQQVEELDLSGYGRKTKGCPLNKYEKLKNLALKSSKSPSSSQGESTLPERIISKTKAPRQQQQEEPTGSSKTEGYGK